MYTTQQLTIQQVKRTESDSDSNYYDVFEMGQDVYEFLKDQIRVHRSDGSTQVVLGNSLITKWPFGNSRLTSMHRIATVSNVPKNLKDLSTYEIPTGVWNDLIKVTFPANYFADGMEVPKPNLPVLTNSAVLLGSKIINKALKKFHIE